MTEYPFPHDGPVRVVSGDWFETAYYARDKKKYRRARGLGAQTWQETTEQEIDNDTFWMIVACLERRRRNA